VSIKANKMALAAGVSALALMVMSSAVMAQEVITSDPIDCCGPIATPEPTDPLAGVDPEVITIDDGVMIDDGGLGVTDEPTDPMGVDPEVIMIDDGGLDVTDEPTVINTLGGVDDTDTGDALVDILPVDGPDLAVDEADITPTGLHMLDDGTVVGVEVVEKSIDVAAQNSAPAHVKAFVSAQDRVARASAVPNLCDTAAGQTNQFFCGSYNKK
jgi:hypothetical protein